MNSFKKSLNSMNWFLKIVLVIIYDVYGILIRITSGKPLPVIIGVLQIFSANIFGLVWLIDLITVLFKKDITVLAK